MTKKDDIDPKELKIVFAPGCFDDFDGTQEELDALMAQIREMATNGDMLANSDLVDFDKLMAEDPELAEHLMQRIEEFDLENPTEPVANKKLH
jgi:hypothetical protein